VLDQDPCRMKCLYFRVKFSSLAGFSCFLPMEVRSSCLHFIVLFAPSSFYGARWNFSRRRTGLTSSRPFPRCVSGVALGCYFFFSVLPASKISIRSSPLPDLVFLVTLMHSRNNRISATTGFGCSPLSEPNGIPHPKLSPIPSRLNEILPAPFQVPPPPARANELREERNSSTFDALNCLRSPSDARLSNFTFLP